MNSDKQRIAIAEYCGTDMYINDKLYSTPDYLNDLNAMHEAEKNLTTDQLIQQAEWIGACSDEMHMKAWVILLRATAAQRAEAFLKTIGKWEESA